MNTIKIIDQTEYVELHVDLSGSELKINTPKVIFRMTWEDAADLAKRLHRKAAIHRLKQEDSGVNCNALPVSPMLRGVPLPGNATGAVYARPLPVLADTAVFA